MADGNGVTYKTTALGDRFYLNGKPFDMWGIRTASATKDTAQMDHLIAQLEDYKAHGVNTVTVFYMGSSGANYDPFSSDGLSIDSGYQQRMEHIIQACDNKEMAVIVGIFYQHAPFGLKNAEAVRNTVRTVTRSLKAYRNIIINIANEQNSGGWNDTADIFDFRDPQRIIELCQIVHQEDPARLVGCGGYDKEKNKIIGKSTHVDILLFDTDGPEDSGMLYDEYVSSGVKGKPIVNVEVFGGWTSKFERGVFPDSVRRAYYGEVNAAVSRKGLSTFFHSSPWCQVEPMRYDLAGYGTSADPGIRWFFKYVQSLCKEKVE
ncbi:MAG: cellulase family glycosylhydrolase [Candidatus Poribacteria bacterium]